MRKRTCKIWSVSKEQLVKLVAEANSFSEVLRGLDLTTKGTGNFQRLKSRLTEEGIDFSHIRSGLDSNKGRKFGASPHKIPLDKILVQGSYYNRFHLKKRLIESGHLEYKCYRCGISEWQGESLTLELDHINGDSTDNRLFNLRLACPNCHSLTESYSGKNRKW